MEIAQTHFLSHPESQSDAEACVRAVLRYHGIAFENVRLFGETMLDIYNVLSDAGLDVNGYEGSVARLRTLSGPTILHLNVDEKEGRFVVCFGYESGKFVIGDPRRGIRRHAAPDLARRWTTRALLVVGGCRDHDADRFRSFGMSIVDFGRTRTLVSTSRTASPQVLSRSEMEALLSAEVFRTLEGHEAWMCAEAARRHAGAAPVVPTSTLETWVDAGLLVSENELRASLVRLVPAAENDSDAGRRVTSICIPTRERSRTLVRALRGYLSNTRAHGVAARFIIAGSASPENRAYLDGQLEVMRTEFGRMITHLDDTWKARLGKDIEAETNCDPALLKFALFGDECCQTNYGANRNALLLSTLGELCIQVDDDTILPGFAVPGSRSGISVSSRFDPNEYWFDESGWESAGACEVDFVRLHEDMLGRHPGMILGEYPPSEIFVDDLKSPLLHALNHPGARVGVTFLGHDGDAGTATNGWRLFLDGDSLGRLVRPGYAQRIRRRASGRTVTRRTIGDGQFFVAMNVGLDNRDVLPPFMPVGRNEDGVFSAAIAACRPRCLRGFREGFVIQHRPAEIRRPFASPIRFEGLKANDIIALLIRERCASRPPGVGSGLRRIGEDLAEFGSLDQSDFDGLVRSFVQRNLGITIGDIERTQAARGSMCPELKADLSTYLHSMEAFTVRRDCGVPVDLDGSVPERRTHFRMLVRTYGELLIHWPDVVQCTRYVLRNHTESV